MLRCACAALAAMLALMALPVYAQDEKDEDSGDNASEEAEETETEVDFNRTGLYLSIAPTWGVEAFDNTNDIQVKDAVGVNARVGYRLLPWFSLEVVGEYLPQFSMDFGAQDGRLAIWNAGANVRLNLPTDLIQPYIIVGGGYIGADLSGIDGEPFQDGHSGFGRIGAGIEFYPWEHVGLDGGLAYIIPGGDVDDLKYLSITAAVIYRF